VGLWVLVCLLAGGGEVRADRPGEPEFVTQGALLTSQGSQMVKMPLKHTRVAIRVTGHLARATVEQRFENPHQRPVEAVYIFPLPSAAAISGYTLVSGERQVVGKLLPRKKARAVYRRAKAAGQVAALMTQRRPNLFVQRVANLAPGAPVKVQLQYTQPLAHLDGARELVFPMVAGPRFISRARRAGGREELLSPPVLPPHLRSAHDIQLSVTLAPGLPLRAVHSPSHRIQVQRLPGHEARVTLHEQDRIPNRDFVLRYRVADGTSRGALLLSRPPGSSQGHFMLTLHPPAARTASPALPRELIFVLDTSSSMAGAPLQRARALVRGCLGALGPADTFQMVRFAEGVSTLGPRMIRNTPRNLELARRWLSLLRPGGGTFIGQGLSAALDLPHDPNRLRLVVFISDGYVGDEAKILALVARRLGQARLFTLGVGSAVNRYLLTEMALAGRGAAEVVGHDQPVAAAVERFVRRIDTPALTGLKLRFEGMQVRDLSRQRLPDLFAAEPLSLLGRFTGDGPARVVVTGTRGGQRVTMTAAGQVSHEPALAKAWARARLASLERRRLRRGTEALEREMATLALDHGLLSRHTAFVAVDRESFVPGEATRVDVAVDRPAGLLRHIGARSTLGGLALSGVGYGGGGAGAGSVGVMAYRVAAPQIRVGQAVITGHLDREIIRRTIRRQINRVKAAYERQLKARPDLAGKLVVRITIDEKGAVTDAAVASSDMGCPELEREVVAVVRTWTFPAAAGGGVVVVNYPFIFKRAE